MVLELAVSNFGLAASDAYFIPERMENDVLVPATG
jgi:hypothetical protein